jgi:DNA polymerase (family 10)
MENPEVAQIFDEVADLLELQGDNPFRIRAYRRAAVTVRDLPESLTKVIADTPERLTELPGIAADLAGKISTIVKTGDLPLRQELCKKFPPGLRQLMTIPGCGPKRAMILHKKLKVKSIEDLRQAAANHRISKLKGFGTKTEENIANALEQLSTTAKRMYYCDAQAYAEAIVHDLRDCPAIGHINVGGSYRRRKETVGDLDILVTCRNSRKVMDRLVEFDGVAEVLARGKTKCSVRLRNGLQLDLRAVPEQSYGAALVYFTGSKQHNILLRRLGQQRGFKINEYGVFRGNRCVAGRTEEEVYRAVGLPCIPPELREARNEIELAQEGKLPKLLNADNIRGDFHMHTTATDGRSSIAEMIHAAKARGYKYIAITDHSKRVTMAKGLDATRLRRHWREIEKEAAKIKGIIVLRGVEVDILENGKLDLADSVLAEADWVAASIHYGQNQTEKQITRRITSAIENRHVDVIGHPTGRLIGKRKPYAVNLNDMFRAAADYGCMLELNCQPSRLDLDEIALVAAKKYSIPIVLGTDAHSTDELRFMEYGVNQARRGGLEAKDVINTRSWSQIGRSLRGSKVASSA